MDTELARIEGRIELGEELALASGKPERQITFTFGRTDVPSQNRDFVPKEEIEKVADRLPTQAIDLHHNVSLTIGAFASAIRFVPQADGEFFGADGKLWAWRFPEEVEAIAQAHAQGLLAGSMEMAFGRATCSECDEEFGPNAPYGPFFQHLREKHGGNGHRVLRDLDPRGAAILLKNIDQPGYEGTRVLALAAKTREEVANMTEDPKKKPVEVEGAKVPAPEKGAEVALAAELGTLTERFKKLETDQEALTTERDELQAWRAQREEADAIAAKAPERLDAFTKAVKEKLGEAYTIGETVLEKVRAKAAKVADEVWTEFSADALDLLTPAGEPAIAKKVGGDNAPAPTGGTLQPEDDKDKDPLPHLRAALNRVYRGGPDEAALALASRVRSRRRAADGDDKEED